MPTDSVPATEIVRGIPLEQRPQAAEIYYEAFARKLTPILGTAREEAIAILHEGLNPDNAFVALREGRVLGLLGFHHAGRALVEVGPGALLKRFGLLRGAGRALLGAILAREPAAGELLMDGIAVHADARGQGTGTRLFAALFAFAAQEGYTSIRLEVIDTNPRARQLYERLGFVAEKTEAVPFLKCMGFSAVTTMRCAVQGYGSKKEKPSEVRTDIQP